jgi:hypothetical protein
MIVIKKIPAIFSKKNFSRDPVKKFKRISAISHDPPSSTIVKPPQNPL